MSSNSLDQRKKEFKKGIDTDECRRRRDDDAFQIRKIKREEKLDKKRRESNGNSFTTPTDKVIDESQVKKIYSDNPTIALAGLMYLRKLASHPKYKHCSALSKMKITDKLVDYLTYVNYPNHQYEAAWILTNILSGPSEIAKPIIDNSMLGSHLVTLLKTSKNDKIRSQVIWCLGNIAGEKGYSDILVDKGVFDILLLNMNCEKKNLDDLRTEIWTVSNIIRESTGKFSKLMKCIPVLKKIVNSYSDNEALTDALWALLYLSKKRSNDELQVFVNMGLIDSNFMRLLSQSGSYVTPMLRFVGNLAAGNDYITQAVLDAGFMTYVPKFLVSKNNSTKQETCWILSNIMAGTTKQIDTVIKANVLYTIIDLLENGKWEIKKECAYVIINLISSGTPEQIDSVLKLDVIRSFVKILSMVSCTEVIIGVLESVYKLLKLEKDEYISNDFLSRSKYKNQIEEHGLDYIESLQTHNNVKVYENAVKIIETFYYDDEVVKMDIESNKYKF